MSFYSTADNRQLTNVPPTSNSVVAGSVTVNNRLKLLKKRNALKKSHSNGGGYLVIDQPYECANTTVYETTPINNFNYDDYRSQNSLNRNSAYLSRISLNTAATNFEQMSHHKSNDTLNDEINTQLKSLSRVKSTPHINQINVNGMDNQISRRRNSSKLKGAQRTRSENEIANLNDGYRLGKVDSHQNSTFKSTQKCNQQLEPQSKDDLTSNQNVQDFNILWPNVDTNYYQRQISQPIFSSSTKYSVLNSLNSNMPLELFEPSPYNIMSDPVICEQFRKLYEEDEYFQNVHKKCIEWLKKSVFAELDNV